MPEADYILLQMMQPFWRLQSVLEGGHTIGHHISTMEVKGRSKGLKYK